MNDYLQDTNLTTARIFNEYNITHAKRDTDGNPEFTIEKAVVVYDPKHPEKDNSNQFRIRSLYEHFPEGVKIFQIVVFDRKRFGSEVNDITHHALVYTEG